MPAPRSEPNSGTTRRVAPTRGDIFLTHLLANLQTPSAHYEPHGPQYGCTLCRIRTLENGSQWGLGTTERHIGTNRLRGARSILLRPSQSRKNQCFSTHLETSKPLFFNPFRCTKTIAFRPYTAIAPARFGQTCQFLNFFGDRK